ncbi:MAG: peptidoglycan DD-metalloendopeptidase family protein [Hyphomicrobiaceae bacterium]|nr:peptidoglycan DD-metalloendopeptidase family protein [Hyphomicrobiaceae bacterium]
MLASYAFAQSGDRTETKLKLEKTKQDFQRTQDRIRAITTDVDALTAERARLNRQLLDAGREAQSIETRMTAIEGRIADLGKQRDKLRLDLASQHRSIIKLLAAMQRMGRDPPPVIVTQRTDALRMVRSAMLLAKAFPELKDKAEALNSQLKALAQVLAKHKTESDRLRSEASRLAGVRTQLAGLLETKRQTLVDRRRELEELQKTAKLLSRNAANLGELIARLDKAVERQTKLGKYNATVPREPVGGVVAAPPAAQPPNAVEIAPGAGTQTASLGRLEPPKPFYQMKGSLPLPASGQTIVGFGERTQYGARSKGMVIKTRQQARITSPCDGWVVYAGDFRSYGQLLIINAGAGYHVLLAGLSRIDVQLGQFVLASEPVGSMPGALRGRSGDTAPALYVEFRKDGQPIDPGPWWAKGQQRVQG